MARRAQRRGVLIDIRKEFIMEARKEEIEVDGTITMNERIEEGKWRIVRLT
jgi:hypothetical protein